jgi:hypothetical protein
MPPLTTNGTTTTSSTRHPTRRKRGASRHRRQTTRPNMFCVCARPRARTPFHPPNASHICCTFLLPYLRLRLAAGGSASGRAVCRLGEPEVTKRMRTMNCPQKKKREKRRAARGKRTGRAPRQQPTGGAAAAAETRGGCVRRPPPPRAAASPVPWPLCISTVSRASFGPRHSSGGTPWGGAPPQPCETVTGRVAGAVLRRPAAPRCATSAGWASPR